MRDAVELVGHLTVTGWKLLCAMAVLALGVRMLDRRERSRVARPVRRVANGRPRRAA